MQKDLLKLTDVAVAVGRTASLLRTYRRTDDAAPRIRSDNLESLGEWQAYFAAKGPNTRGTKGTNREQLLCTKLERAITLSDLEIATRKGELVPLTEVHELHAAIYGQAVSTMRRLIENDLPQRIYGSDMPRIKAACRKCVDEVLKSMQDGIEKWEASKKPTL